MAEKICVSCNNPVDDDTPYVVHGRQLWCEDCDFVAAQEEAFNCPRDEPVDAGLAHQDNLDRWHGPHHG